MARNLCNFVNGFKPTMVIVMVLVQIGFAGLNIFYKLATRDGMNMRILVAYRFIFATIFLAPLAFFIERNSRSKLTWMVTFQAFLCGFFGGTLCQNLYVASLTLTSATIAAAMTNLIPAITYIMAVTFGMEKIGIQTLAGKVKLVGTTIGIGGAMVVTFYAGPEINIWLTTVDLSRGIQRGTASTLASHADESRNRILGTLLSLGSSISYALWLIIQGIVASGLMFTMIAWGLRVKGPLFVSTFNRLTLVFVAIMGSLLLEEKLYVGSVVGSVLIILGLYALLWGKRKEMKRMSPLMPLMNSGEAEEHLEVVTETSTNNNPEINFHNLATGASNVSEEDEEEVAVKKNRKDEKEIYGIILKLKFNQFDSNPLVELLLRNFWL